MIRYSHVKLFSVLQLKVRFFNNSTVVYDSFSGYLSALGYTDKCIQDAMRKTLSQSFSCEVNDSHLKMLGNEGLQALAMSINRNMESNSSPNGIVHVFIPHHNSAFDVCMKYGHTFMQYVNDDENGKRLLGEYLECSCGGNMSCSTCHIILDPESYAKCDPPSEAEMDMLDLSFQPTETSRLGCQIRMKKELDGMKITIPAGVYNLWK